ncbi:MAG: YfiR family protein [Gammaproteobacteria bacterium]|nr:YfiR family protein [Gammaproteobacteria bacterium]
MMKCLLSTRVGQLLLLGLCFMPVPDLHADTFSDHEVKAVFLYNFPNFVRWPESAFQSDEKSFVYCGMSDSDPVIMTLKALIKGEKVQSRTIRFQYLRRIENINQCQVLFLSQENAALADRLIEAAEGTSVLFVSDLRQFAVRGGLIELTEVDGRIRPTINIEQLEKTPLKVSSKLLRLAKRVRKIK